MYVSLLCAPSVTTVAVQVSNGRSGIDSCLACNFSGDKVAPIANGARVSYAKLTGIFRRRSPRAVLSVRELVEWLIAHTGMWRLANRAPRTEMLHQRRQGVLQILRQEMPCCCSHDRNLSIAKGFKSVNALCHAVCSSWDVRFLLPPCPHFPS